MMPYYNTAIRWHNPRLGIRVSCSSFTMDGGDTMSDPWSKGPVRTTQELADRIERDPWVADEIKKDPVKVIRTIGQSPLEFDVWIYRLVVLALGLAVLMAVGGAIFLTWSTDKQVPQVLVALGSAAVGALAGLLAPSPTKRAE